MGAGRRLNNRSRSGIPNWVSRPRPGMYTGPAFKEIRNPITGEVFNAPNTGYRLNDNYRSRRNRYQDSINRIQAKPETRATGVAPSVIVNPIERPRRSENFNINRFQQLLSNLKDSKIRQQRQRSESRNQDAINRIRTARDIPFINPFNIRSRRDDYQNAINRIQNPPNTGTANRINADEIITRDFFNPPNTGTANRINADEIITKDFFAKPDIRSRRNNYQDSINRIQANPNIRSRRDEYRDTIKRLQGRF